MVVSVQYSKPVSINVLAAVDFQEALLAMMPLLLPVQMESSQTIQKKSSKDTSRENPLKRPIVPPYQNKSMGIVSFILFNSLRAS